MFRLHSLVGEIDLSDSMDLLMNIIELFDLDDVVGDNSSGCEINGAK